MQREHEKGAGDEHTAHAGIHVGVRKKLAKWAKGLVAWGSVSTHVKLSEFCVSDTVSQASTQDTPPLRMMKSIAFASFAVSTFAQGPGAFWYGISPDDR